MRELDDVLCFTDRHAFVRDLNRRTRAAGGTEYNFGCVHLCSPAFKPMVQVKVEFKVKGGTENDAYR
jgi:hypothetical protein